MSHKLKVIFVIIVIIYSLFFVWRLFTSRPDQTLSKTDNITNSENLDGIYKNSQYGFSFQKPNGYNIGEFDQENGKIILVQMSKAAFDTTSFQILITPFDEPEAIITKARINKEIPGLKVENAKEILVGAGKGLQFESDNPVFGGKSAEIWFVHNSNLYQLSGYKEAMPVMEQVIASWTFQ